MATGSQEKFWQTLDRQLCKFFCFLSPASHSSAQPRQRKGRFSRDLSAGLDISQAVSWKLLVRWWEMKNWASKCTLFNHIRASNSFSHFPNIILVALAFHQLTAAFPSPLFKSKTYKMALKVLFLFWLQHTSNVFAKRTIVGCFFCSQVSTRKSSYSTI